MATDTVELSFGELLKAAIDYKAAQVIPVAPSVFVRHHNGNTEIRLPTMQEHAISASNVTAGTSESAGFVTWLSGGARDEIERRLTFIPVTSKEGEIPFGAELPQTAMVSEHGTSPFTEGGFDVVSESDYELDYIESRLSVSNTVLIQSETLTLDGLETALQQASREIMVDQILAGSGVGVEMQGAEGLTIPSANDMRYTPSGVDPSGILDAEELLEDNSARRADLVWAFGTELHSYLQRAIIDPGSGAFMLSDGRTFSGLPGVRSSALDANAGILIDAREAVKLPVSVEGQLFVNRVSRPGDSLLTLRTHITTTWTRPELVVRLLPQ